MEFWILDYMEYQVRTTTHCSKGGVNISMLNELKVNMMDYYACVYVHAIFAILMHDVRSTGLLRSANKRGV